ncbi:MAG: hypothetical protein Q8904_11225 [Bacteroidota bacterium]|nr:hypothetical protein [Bacteroidota bacterium]
MSKINIKLSGVAAELVLGNYMPKDATIFNDWQDFFHFNDLIHETQLLAEHIAEIEIRQDEEMVFKGKIPGSKLQPLKSFSPVLVQRALYLRTECAEQAVYQCEFETDGFDKEKLFFDTQDYDLLFKVGKSFISNVRYDNQSFPLEWVSAQPIGNICLLCRCDAGYLVPVYDAIKKVAVK